jgi:ethanolamine utilization microcompartment shell protein EutL
LAPDPDGTADVAVPGERLPAGEIDARIGWLIETDITDAGAALRNDDRREAAECLTRARSALRKVAQRAAGRAHDLAVPPTLDVTLARAEAALSAGDRETAEHALTDSEQRLRVALTALDADLLPQSGGPR